MNIKSAPMLAALLALPLAALGATAATCKPGPPTPESYRWNFPQEASQLLDGIRMDAAKVTSQANHLENWTWQSGITWELHAEQLQQVRDEVNDMGRKLCRLRVIRRVTSPWEQAAIDRAGKNIQLLADNTQDAILFLNRYEGNFWEQPYRRYTTNIYSQSHMLSNTLREYVEYAKVNQEDRHLRRELGLNKSTS